MEWLSQNWVFLLVAVAFVALHMFGHGGHGGGHGGDGRREDRDRKPGRDDQAAPRGGHQH